jgi:exodeoxyribonuclease VII large subunit
MAIPARAELVADLSQKSSRLLGSLNQLLHRQRLRLSLAGGKLPDLPALLGSARQRLDDRSERLGLARMGMLERRRSALVAVERRLPDLPALLTGMRERVRDRGLRLIVALPNLVGQRGAALGLAGQKLLGALRQSVGRIHTNAGRVLGRPLDAPLRASLREGWIRVEGAAGRLESVSPLAVLQRGYALVTDTSGYPLTSAKAIKPGARMTVRFADGEVRATAEGGKPASRQGVLPI